MKIRIAFISTLLCFILHFTSLESTSLNNCMSVMSSNDHHLMQIFKGWDTDDLEQRFETNFMLVRNWDAHEGPITKMIYHAEDYGDDEYFVTFSKQDNEVKVWEKDVIGIDVPTYPLQDKSMYSYNPDFDPEPSYLLQPKENSNIKIKDIAYGKEMIAVASDNQCIYIFCFQEPLQKTTEDNPFETTMHLYAVIQKHLASALSLNLNDTWLATHISKIDQLQTDLFKIWNLENIREKQPPLELPIPIVEDALYDEMLISGYVKSLNIYINPEIVKKIAQFVALPLLRDFHLIDNRLIMTFSNIGIKEININELQQLKSVEKKNGCFDPYKKPCCKHLKEQGKNHLTPTYLSARDWIALEQFDPKKYHGEIVIYDLAGKLLHHFGQLDRSQKQASRFTISAYGDLLSRYDMNGCLEIWDIGKGKMLGKPPGTYPTSGYWFSSKEGYFILTQENEVNIFV